MSDATFNTAEEFLALVDEAKKTKSESASIPTTPLDNTNLILSKPVQDLNISYVVKIDQGNFTLTAPELGLSVTTPDYKLTREIMLDLAFVEVNRRYSGSAGSLEDQLVYILYQLNYPETPEDYRAATSSYSYKLPGVAAIEYVLGDWQDIHKALAR